MSHACHSLLLSLIAGVMIVVSPAAGQQDDKADASRTFEQILAEHPTPRLEDLAERASPQTRGDVATEAFYDLLKLRETRPEEAVSELVRVMEVNNGSTRIHRFAAAQALFAIGTEPAHEALREHLLDPAYPVEQAFDYTAYWDMAEPQRSELIRQYLLRDLTEDLQVTIEAGWRDTDDGRRLLVTVRLTNQSAEPSSLLDWQVYQARHLYFASPRGRFLPQQEFVRYNMPMPQTTVLQSGQSVTHEVELTLRQEEAYLERSRDAQAVAVLRTHDIQFPLRAFGEYRLYAMVQQAPLNTERLDEQMRERYQAEHWWAGRAVSEPVTVTIRPDDVAKNAPTDGSDPRPEPTELARSQLVEQNQQLRQQIRHLQEIKAEFEVLTQQLRVELQHLQQELKAVKAQLRQQSEEGENGDSRP